MLNTTVFFCSAGLEPEIIAPQWLSDAIKILPTTTLTIEPVSFTLARGIDLLVGYRLYSNIGITILNHQTKNKIIKRSKKQTRS